MLDMQSTAPKKAIMLAERAQFVLDHPAWKFADYDSAAAGDIAFLREFEKMRAVAQERELEKLKAEQIADGRE